MSTAPARPANAAGDRHREEVVARHRDAAVARRLRVEADGAHLEAERRAVDDDPVHDEHRDRDEDPDREALEQLRGPRRRAASRRRRCRSRSGSTSAALCSGPPWPKRYEPTQIAIQLSMIVEITSCAPTVAFRMPGDARVDGAGERADDQAEHRRAGTGSCSRTTSRARPRSIVPTRYWPWPPMLNMPQRKANATARPVRMIGVVRSSVCCRFCAAIDAVSHGNHMCAVPNGTRALVVADVEEPVEARAVEDRLVDLERVLAGERRRRGRPSGRRGWS